MAAMEFDGAFEAVYTSSKISTRPVMIYENGKRTDRQAVDDQGRPLFVLEGAHPLFNGTVLTDGKVQVNREIDTRSVRVLDVFKGQGTLALSGGDFGTIRGTLTLNMYAEEGK